MSVKKWQWAVILALCWLTVSHALIPLTASQGHHISLSGLEITPPRNGLYLFDLR